MQCAMRKRKVDDNNGFGNENKKKPVDQARRKALKTIVAGTAAVGVLAVSSKWSKPVVDTIILPAHAQATNVEGPVQENMPEENTISCTCYAVSYSNPNVNYPEYSTEGDGAMMETITVTLSPDEVAPNARPATLQKKRKKK